jgi:hypothetical protein
MLTILIFCLLYHKLQLCLIFHVHAFIYMWYKTFEDLKTYFEFLKNSIILKLWVLFECVKNVIIIQVYFLSKFLIKNP